MDKWSQPVVTNQVRDWFQALDDKSKQAYRGAMEALRIAGPALGRPIVAEIDLRSYSPEIRKLFPHLKELRPLGTTQRVLFTFGPDRRPVMLFAGDKAGNWTKWYAQAVKEAAKSYRAHLSEAG